MPAYQTSGSITALYPGDQATVINAEKPASGIASQQVALSQSPNGGQQKLSVSLQFAAAPGAFSVQLETADVDVDSAYVVEGAPITAVDALFAARAEFPSIVALFARLRTVTQNANAVNCTGTITR